MRVALIQMSVTADKEKNIAAACEYIRRAAEQGADRRCCRRCSAAL